MRRKEPLDLQEEFRSQSPMDWQDYRPAAVWEWNDRINPTEIRRQLRLLISAGIGSVVLRPAFGLESPFMGEDWLDGVEAAVDESRRAGIGLWIGDGAGRILPANSGGAQRPAALQRKALRFETIPGTSPGGASIDQLRRETTIAFFGARVVDGKLIDCRRIHADPAPPVDPTPPGESIPESPDPAADHSSVEPAGEASPGQDSETTKSDELAAGDAVTLHFFWQADGMVDWLDVSAVRSWMNSVHEPFYREFGEAFGRTIRGISLDGPELPALPWSATLPSIYEELFQRDLLDALPELVFETADSSSTRAGFRRSISAAFARSCTDQLSLWCAHREILLTGFLDGSVASGSPGEGFWKCNPAIAMPGAVIDAGALQESLAALLEVKEAVTAARTTGGRARVDLIWEQGNVNGEQLARGATFAAAAGASFVCLYRFPYSLRGHRKEKSAKGLFHEAVLASLRPLHDSITRRAFLMSRGKPVVDVLLLRTSDADALESLVRAMASIPRDFDLIDEATLAGCGEIDEGRLKIGASRYRAVVVADLNKAGKPVLELLGRFLEAGGIVIGAAPLPGAGRPGRRSARQLSGVRLIAPEATALREALRFSHPTWIAEHEDGETVELQCQQRDAGRYQFFLIANPLAGTEARVRITLPAEGRLEEWDCGTGAVTPLSVEHRDDRATARIVIPAGRASVLCLDLARPAWSGAPRVQRVTETVALSSDWRLELRDPNVIRLDRCAFKLGEGEWRGEAPLPAVQEAIHRSPHAGEALLRFIVDAAGGTPLKQMSLVIESPERWSVTVNGRPLPPKDQGAWIDRSWRRFDVSRLLQPGRNIILLKMIYPPAPAGDATGFEDRRVIAPLYLLGPFDPGSPVPTAAGVAPFSIGPLGGGARSGNLRLQGFPFFCGAAVLHQTVLLPRRPGDTVYLEMEPPDCISCRVMINGGFAGNILSPAHRLEITGWIRPGKNGISIELVSGGASLLDVGSLANMGDLSEGPGSQSEKADRESSQGPTPARYGIGRVWIQFRRPQDE